MAHFHQAVRFSTVRYGTQLYPLPLSETVHGTQNSTYTYTYTYTTFLVLIRWGT